MSRVTHILVVDDNRSIRDSLAKILRKQGYKVTVAEDGEVAIACLQADTVHLVLTDLRMPRLDGLQLTQFVHRTYPRVPLVLMTAHGSMEIALEAIKEGADAYIEKPLRRTEVVTVVERALVRRALTYQSQGTTPDTFPNSPGELIGKSKSIRNLLVQIQRLADESTSALILGEPGTGRDVIAYAIHCLGNRNSQPFLIVSNDAQQMGLLELASVREYQAEQKNQLAQVGEGTIFLDFAGQVGHNQQAMCVQLLQQYMSAALVRNVRVLVGLNEMPSSDNTGLSLLSTFVENADNRVIQIPAIRNRTEDVPLLVGHFLRVYGDQYGKTIRSVSDSALDVLLEHSWPGNVSELAKVIAQAVLKTEDGVVRLTSLPSYLCVTDSSNNGGSTTPNGGCLEKLDRRMLVDTLRREDPSLRISVAPALLHQIRPA